MYVRPYFWEISEQGIYPRIDVMKFTLFWRHSFISRTCHTYLAQSAAELLFYDLVARSLCNSSDYFAATTTLRLLV